MVEKLSVQIELEGGKEVEKQLEGIGEAGKKAFDQLEQSATQAGGFRNLKPEEVTQKLKELGVTGVDSINQIQDAVKTAGRWEGMVLGVRALEDGFLAVAKAAAVVGTAVVAAAVALSRYTSEAAKVAEALGPLADLSGQTMQSVSALQIAFAQGGVSAQKFASEFTALEQRVQEAAAGMAAAVEASQQRIVHAQQASAQAAQSAAAAGLALEEAQLNAQRARGAEISKDTQDRLARQKADLAVQQAQLALAAAQQAQADAAHNLRVAQANDLTKIIDLYKQMGAGVKVAFDPLTSAATKNIALLSTLAQAGDNWKFVLADILMNATALERVQIGKALALDQQTIERLQLGSAVLRAQQQAVVELGIALSAADQNNLRAFTNSWNTFGAVAGAALEKIGAAVAPLGTLLAQGLLAGLTAAINQVNTLIAAFQGLRVLLDLVGTGGVTVWNAIDAATDGAFTTLGKYVAGLLGIDWPSFSAAAETAWGIVAGAAWRAINPLQAILDLLARIKAASLPKPGSADFIGPVQPGVGGLPAASGGLIWGRGTGTSDSIPAWLSHGEYVTPARAVAQPGVLAFLEALRRSGGNLRHVLDGMGRFALGGMVMPGAIPAFARGGLNGGSNASRVLNLTIEGRSFSGLSVPESTAQALERFAVHSQMASTGRRPSWKR